MKKKNIISIETIMAARAQSARALSLPYSELIGLTGPKGVGKSTLACNLTDSWGEVLSFAEPIRQMLEQIVPRDCLTDKKEEVIPWLGVTGRQMLQRLGTEFGRNLDSDIWVNIAQRSLVICDSTPIIFDDVRFPNEAKMIKRNGGQVWRLTRAGIENTDTHSSEDGIPEELIDRVVEL